MTDEKADNIELPIEDEPVGDEIIRFLVQEVDGDGVYDRGFTWRDRERAENDMEMFRRLNPHLNYRVVQRTDTVLIDIEPRA